MSHHKFTTLTDIITTTYYQRITSHPNTTRNGIVFPSAFYARIGTNPLEFLRHLQVCRNPIRTKKATGRQKRDGGIMYSGSPISLMPPPNNRQKRDQRTYTSQTLKVAFDAEWTTDPENPKRRQILSLQACLLLPDGNMLFWLLDYVPRGGLRVSLSTALSWFWCGLSGLGAVDKSNVTIWEIVGHYGIVDATIFRDSQAILRNVDAARRTLVTIREPYKIALYDGRQHRISSAVVFFRDTMLLSPAGSSLAKLGEAMGMPKLDLPTGYTKDRMDIFKNERPSDYIDYALRDVEVTMEWVKQTTDTSEMTPITLGGMAAKGFRGAIMEYRKWDKAAFDKNLRGLDTIYVYDDNGKKRKELIEREDSGGIWSAATKAYYGGRNECFLFGVHPSETGWFDYDLSGAYPAAMAMLKDIDYNVEHAAILHGPLQIQFIKPSMYFFADVRFEFPDGEMYPCIPVRDKLGRGLIFPRRGRAWATAPEIYLALYRGAKITIITPAPVYAQHDGVGSLAIGIKAMVEARAEAKRKYGKGSPQEKAAKERANSCYGKLAQGLAGKRAYSPRHDQVEAVGPSGITAAPYAAYVTAMVRALVSAALCHLSDMGYRVASVTTDGFLTDAPCEIIKKLHLFGLRQSFQDARRWLTGEDTVWEVKHYAKALVMAKTRGGAGNGEGENLPVPVAAAGVRLRCAPDERPEQFIKAFLERGEDGKAESKYNALPTVQAYVRKDADAIGQDVVARISLEYDYKRELIPPYSTELIEIDGVTYEHASASSRPWETVEEFAVARESLRRAPAAKLPAELDDNNARIKRYGQNLRARGGVRRSGAVSALRAIRALEVKPAWTAGLTGIEICKRVGEVFGVELGGQDWKDAGRKTRTVYSLKGYEKEAEALGLITK